MIQYIIVGIILAVTLLFAIRRIVRTAKGKGGCAGCSQCEHCPSKENHACSCHNDTWRY